MPAPWERKTRESEEAYQAFLIYRDLGADRTLDRVRQEWGKSGVGKAQSLIERWSSQHAWVERCREWDNHLQAARDREAAKRAADLERRRLRELDEVWDDAMALRAKVRDMLKVPHMNAKTEKTETIVSDDGKTVINQTFVTIEPARWAFRDVATMAKAAAELACAVLNAHGQDTAALSDAALRGIIDAAGGQSEPGGSAGEPGQPGTAISPRGQRRQRRS